MDQVQEFLRQPLVQAVIGGVIVAAVEDIAAFRRFESFDEAKAYRWDIALWRWFRGGTVGLLTGLGIAGIA
jgi:hypothetical protein